MYNISFSQRELGELASSTGCLGPCWISMFLLHLTYGVGKPSLKTFFFSLGGSMKNKKWLGQGKSYIDKRFDELTFEEQKKDFEWKNYILESYGRQLTSATFYQDYLFKEIPEEKECPYRICLNEYESETTKIHKIDLDEIDQFFSFKDVAISPALYWQNYKREDLLNYVLAFVMDVDKMRPQDLDRFFQLFDENRVLRPTVITNSGSGVHFYYILDKPYPVDVIKNMPNRNIAFEIYKKLYDTVIFDESYRAAQRHWIGQDYRVVGSKTKLNQTATAFLVGDLYTIDQLINHYKIDPTQFKRQATYKMKNYATNIARDLKIDLPDFTSYKETYDFIYFNKDAAYEARHKRKKRKKSDKKKKEVDVNDHTSWYRNTVSSIQKYAIAGNRFNCLKAMAIIAYKEKIPRDTFLEDLKSVEEAWLNKNWNGDDFNSKNFSAIVRLYDHASKYQNTTAEKLQEWLGWEFHALPVKRNGRPQKVHLEIARSTKKIIKESEGLVEGRPSKQKMIQQWRKEHPDGRKVDCIRDTGLTKPTVYKWWDDSSDVTVKPTPPKKPKMTDEQLIQMFISDIMQDLSAEEITDKVVNAVDPQSSDEERNRVKALIESTQKSMQNILNLVKK